MSWWGTPELSVYAGRQVQAVAPLGCPVAGSKQPWPGWQVAPPQLATQLPAALQVEPVGQEVAVQAHFPVAGAQVSPAEQVTPVQRVWVVTQRLAELQV